jgi:peptide chain release factor 3
VRLAEEDHARGRQAPDRGAVSRGHAVCRARGLPILTFVNKLDHPGREALTLLDEIERVLGIGAVPMNWPIGQGPSFQGVYDLTERRVLRFERTEHNRRQAPVSTTDLADPLLDRALGAGPVRQLREEIELLSGAVTRPRRAGPAPRAPGA